MNVDNHAVIYLPAEVARILKCSEWWVKEQARKGRIPFCWIGGGYRFTPDHLAEIVRQSERKPMPADPIPDVPRARRSRSTSPTHSGTAQLTARLPRRARLAQENGQQKAA